jgi:TolB-like protein/DNA-binding winged helix-turn-helix (wHTH) protein/Tfp pilus assembly protein PilF
MRVEFGEYQLDTESRILQREGRRIRVQSKAFDLLAYLIERRERVVSADELLDALWPGVHVTPAALSAAIQRARQAVGDDGEHQAVLQTEHGKGFRFVAEVIDLSPPETAEPAQEVAPPTPEADRPGSTVPAQPSLIAELKRRNVFRVAAAYGIVAWLLVEVASVVLPTFEAPEWLMQVFTFLVILGFPLAFILAWAFELTPEGIKLETSVDRTKSITQQTGRKLDFAIIGLLALAVVFLVVDHYVLEADQIPASEPVAKGKSVAVLPFVNMTGDPEQEYFADGISESLLNVLASVKGLRVTSRTSAFAFKGTNTAVPEIAEKLGVKHVLEGSFQRAGNRIRISAQLIDVNSDSHLWSASYDRELSDIFAVQDEIAARVGEALEVALLRADSSPVQPSLETSIEAYTDYILARHKMTLVSFADAREAEVLLKAVIERDPNYAPAYAALAGAYWEMAEWGMLSESEAAARMMPLIEQALSLDDGLAEAWQHLAYVHWENRNLESARAAQKRALELDPQNPVVLIGQIRRWTWTHEPERGLVYADRLLRVDPMSRPGMYWVAVLYARLGRSEDWERMIEHMRSIDPKHNDYLWSAWQLALSRGDLVAALGLMEESTRIELDDPDGPWAIAEIYLDLGDLRAADFWIDAAARRDPEVPWVQTTAALLHLYRDEEAEAVAIAHESMRPHGTSATVLRMAAIPDLAVGNYAEIIARYLTNYPELANGKFPAESQAVSTGSLRNAFAVTLDLASAYLHAGNNEKAESLLSLVESELPHWSRTGLWGHGFADVELHALRGEKAQALAALREHVGMGTRFHWRFLLLHDQNLDSIRDEPEFRAMIAEIEADMAAQLERVREMQKSGELTPIPEVSAAVQ